MLLAVLSWRQVAPKGWCVATVLHIRTLNSRRRNYPISYILKFIFNLGTLSPFEIVLPIPVELR